MILSELLPLPLPVQSPQVVLQYIFVIFTIEITIPLIHFNFLPLLPFYPFLLSSVSSLSPLLSLPSTP